MTITPQYLNTGTAKHAAARNGTERLSELSHTHTHTHCQERVPAQPLQEVRLPDPRRPASLQALILNLVVGWWGYGASY